MGRNPSRCVSSQVELHVVSSPGAGLEGIFGCSGLPVGGGCVGTRPGVGKPRERRRAPGGREGRLSLPEMDLGWSRYPEESSLHLPSGPAPLDAQREGRGPPAYEGRFAGGRAGDGQSRTGVRMGSGANQSPQWDRESLELSVLQLGCVCVLWRLCCCERARLFSLFFKARVAAAKAALLLSSVPGFASNLLWCVSVFLA